MKLDEELEEEVPLLVEPPLDDPPEDDPPEEEPPPLAPPPLDAPPLAPPPEVEPDEDPVDVELELDVVDAFVVDPDPLTVSPTELLTAVTVPLISAVSVVPARAFWSAVTVTWSCEAFASSWAIVAGVIWRLA
jgi:hypothetical protein